MTGIIRQPVRRTTDEYATTIISAQQALTTGRKDKDMERISRDNAALCLIDHQTGLLTGVRDIAVGELKHNVVALAKAAQILGLPVIVATTAKTNP